MKQSAGEQREKATTTIATEKGLRSLDKFMQLSATAVRENVRL